MSDVVQKLWGFCHTLRHDGIDYGDYIEQITFLLFLKMADEKGITLPKGCDWPKLRDRSGTALVDHYVDLLRTLGKTPGILGDIYAEAQSRFNNPVNLKRLVNLIDETRVDHAGRGREGRSLRGASGEGRQRGQEGGRAVLHAPRPDPVHRPLHEARPAGLQGIHHLRSGLRHGRLPGGGLRMADPPDQGRGPGPRHGQAGPPEDLLTARTWWPGRGVWP